jgi:hypothetical protein
MKDRGTEKRKTEEGKRKYCMHAHSRLHLTHSGLLTQNSGCITLATSQLTHN